MGAFALGDGTGVGKTRVMCLIARLWWAEALARHPATANVGEARVHVRWITANKTLARMARAEMASYLAERPSGVSVAFDTYAGLMTPARNAGTSQAAITHRPRVGPRPPPMVELIVADECHMARRGRCAVAFANAVSGSDTDRAGATACAVLLSSATMFADVDSVL